MRLTIIRNIVNVSNSINTLSRGEGDLTIRIPVTSSDEIGALTEGVNSLMSKLREIISELYSHHGKLMHCGRLAGEKYQEGLYKTPPFALESNPFKLNLP